MPSVYRIELAKSNRSFCQSTQCKNAKEKISKGELRQGVLIEIKEHQSWKWRHWGCVTPEVLYNWNETSGGDVELIDGHDELPEAEQDRVRRALEQGHVDDEDWNGDIECNRWTGKKNAGMFLKGSAKKQKEAEDADNDGEDVPTPSKPAGKKRKAAKVDGDDEAEDPAPKKARGREPKAVKSDDNDGEVKPAPKKARTKKAAAVDDEVDEDDEPIKAPAAKKGRKAKTTADHNNDAVEDVEAAPATKKSRARKAKLADSDLEEHDSDAEANISKLAPKKKPAKKTAAIGVAHQDGTVDTSKPKPRSRAKAKKATVSDEE